MMKQSTRIHKEGLAWNGNPSSFGKLKLILLFKLYVFFISIFISTNVFALPTDGSVSAGSATISSGANSVEVNQATHKAVINWGSYNIGAHEGVVYKQPSTSSIILNRINPKNGVSKILGKLSANGQVWLINPAGIFFGASAQVNVASLLATTADISDTDFMNGNYHFTQSPDWNGAVINEGQITVADNGLVGLVAPGVENRGTITANAGTVALAAGTEFTLDFYGDNLIHFGVNSKVTTPAVDENGNKLKNAVSNSGSIIASGGKIVLTANAAEDVVDHAINMSGYAEASSAVKRGGDIVLMGGGKGSVVVSGKIRSVGKSQKGGSVKILGNKIAIQDKGSVDVSGDTGGGEILIGGNLRGQGPELDLILDRGRKHLAEFG